MTALPNQVGKDPVVFPLLEILDLRSSQVGASQATPKEDGDDGVGSLATQGGPIEGR